MGCRKAALSLLAVSPPCRHGDECQRCPSPAQVARSCCRSQDKLEIERYLLFAFLGAAFAQAKEGGEEEGE